MCDVSNPSSKATLASNDCHNKALKPRLQYRLNYRQAFGGFDPCIDKYTRLLEVWDRLFSQQTLHLASELANTHPMRHDHHVTSAPPQNRTKLQATLSSWQAATGAAWRVL
jgi:hypothetical protein